MTSIGMISYSKIKSIACLLAHMYYFQVVQVQVQAQVSSLYYSILCYINANANANANAYTFLALSCNVLSFQT